MRGRYGELNAPREQLADALVVLLKRANARGSRTALARRAAAPAPRRRLLPSSRAPGTAAESDHFRSSPRGTGAPPRARRTRVATRPRSMRPSSGALRAVSRCRRSVCCAPMGTTSSKARSRPQTTIRSRWTAPPESRTVALCESASQQRRTGKLGARLYANWKAFRSSWWPTATGRSRTPSATCGAGGAHAPGPEGRSEAIASTLQRDSHTLVFFAYAMDRYRSLTPSRRFSFVVHTLAV